MYEKEIKQESEGETQPLCRACLSIGRKLRPIGKYSDVYKKLIVDYFYTNAEDVKLCWECHAQLRKASLFREQVLKANDIIQYGQCYAYGTLSCLTTVIINDTHSHTIYMTEGYIHTDIKTNETLNDLKEATTNINKNVKEMKNDGPNCSNNDDENITEDVISNDEDLNVVIDIDTKNDAGCENVNDEDVTNDKHETINVERNVTAPSKWAKERALQNKKPKFKTVTSNELVLDEVFTKKQIGVEIIKRCLAKERDSEWFITSKNKCERCVAVFENEGALVKHEDVFHSKDSGKFICDICESRMSRRYLIQHVKRHYSWYECRICGCMCRKNNMRMHLEAHNKVHQCLKCDLLFGSRQEFFSHYKDWHEKFICDHCGVSFKMRYCIKDHLRKQHSKFECTLCSKRFARYNGLWLHNKLRHAPPLPPAYCVECDKHFRDVYRYRWHLANSTRHKPKKKVKIPCPDCEKVFTKRIYMTNHYEFVHLKHFRYRCEECDKNFIRNADLIKHQRKVHEGIPLPKNKICYVCGKGFHTNKILTNHLRTHTGERPFACGACPARFTQRAALGGHARALHAPPHDAPHDAPPGEGRA